MAAHANRLEKTIRRTQTGITFAPRNNPWVVTTTREWHWATGAEGSQDCETIDNLDFMGRMFVIMIQMAYKCQCEPEGWKLTVITPLHKGGDPTLATNYRPIASSHVLQKILLKILYNRLVCWNSKLDPHNGVGLYKLLSPNQAAYLPNRERTEHAVSMMEFMRKHTVVTKKRDRDLGQMYGVFVLFVDLTKAFDSVNHAVLIETLRRRLGLTNDDVFIKFVRNVYDGIRVKAKVNGHFSQSREQEVGIKQGCTLSPLLFILLFNLVDESLRTEIFEEDVSKLDFADDVAILVRNMRDLEKVVRVLHRTFSVIGVIINQKKTMIGYAPPTQAHGIKVRGYTGGEARHFNDLTAQQQAAVEMDLFTSKSKNHTFNFVTTSRDHEETEVSLTFELTDIYTYLGVQTPMDLNAKQIIKSAEWAWAQCASLIYDPYASADLKAKVVNSVVLPVALSNAPIYGLLCISDYTGHQYGRAFKTQIEKQYDERVKMILNSAARIAPRWKERMSSTTDVYYRSMGIVNPRTHAVRLGLNAAMKIITANKSDVGYWLYNHIHSDEQWGATSIIRRAMTYMLTSLRHHQHVFNIGGDGGVTKRSFDLTGAVPRDIKKIFRRQGVDATPVAKSAARTHAKTRNIKKTLASPRGQAAHWAREIEILRKVRERYREPRDSKSVAMAPSNEVLQKGMSQVRTVDMERFDADTLLLRSRKRSRAQTDSKNPPPVNDDGSKGGKSQPVPAERRGMIMQLRSNDKEDVNCRAEPQRTDTHALTAPEHSVIASCGAEEIRREPVRVSFVGSEEFQGLGRLGRDKVKEQITRAAKDARSITAYQKTMHPTVDLTVARATKLGHNPNRPKEECRPTTMMQRHLPQKGNHPAMAQGLAIGPRDYIQVVPTQASSSNFVRNDFIASNGLDKGRRRAEAIRQNEAQASVYSTSRTLRRQDNTVQMAPPGDRGNGNAMVKTLRDRSQHTTKGPPSRSANSQCAPQASGVAAPRYDGSRCGK